MNPIEAYEALSDALKSLERKHLAAMQDFATLTGMCSALSPEDVNGLTRRIRAKADSMTEHYFSAEQAQRTPQASQSTLVED